MSVDEERIYSQLSGIDGFEEFLEYEIVKSRKASCDASVASDHNRACGMAYISNWLEELSSKIYNLQDD